jgi:hypothetical protein
LLYIMDTINNSKNTQFTIYNSAQDFFTIELPVTCSNVEQREQDIPVKSGITKMRNYIALKKNKAFIIGVIELGMVLDDEGKMGLMHQSRAELAENGETLSEGVAEIDGFTALTLRLSQVHGSMKSYVDVAIIVIADKLFQLEVTSTAKELLDEQDAARFFQSFRYIEKKESS